MKLSNVEKNYDKLAKRYDFWTNLVFGRALGVEKYRAQAIDTLGDMNGKTVLDLGCGTGRNFPILVPRVGASGQIIAVDYSQGMLDKANDKIADKSWTNVSLVRDDAASLEKVAGPVDASVSIW